MKEKTDRKEWIEAESHPGLEVNEYGIPAFVRIPVDQYEEARKDVGEAFDLLDNVERLEKALREERSL